jgi:hypothetical protein
VKSLSCQISVYMEGNGVHEIGVCPSPAESRSWLYEACGAQIFGGTSGYSVLAAGESAASHSPADTEGNDPTTVVSSRGPFVLMRSTQKPFSSLWKVTRSMTPFPPSRVCVQGLRHSSGIHLPMDGRPCVTHQEADFAEILLTGGLRSAPASQRCRRLFWPA